MAGIQLGRTRLHTRRQRARMAGQALLALAGLVVALWLAAGLVSWISGSGWQWPHLGLRSPVSGSSDGGLLGLPHYNENTGQVTDAAAGDSGSGARFPVTLTWPGSVAASAVVAVPLWLAWLYLLVRPLRAPRTEARKQGLASLAQIQRGLSAKSARTEGQRTRPDLSPLWRHMAHRDEFGFGLGQPDQPRGRERLVQNWQRGLRVIARPGWGKTFRLLVPVIRALPGPALVTSNEPEIYQYTVAARTRRRTRLRWGWLDALCRRWLPARDYPVFVVDFAPPGVDWGPGATRVRHNPIPGCEDYPGVATRRAEAMITGIDSDDRGSEQDGFFRQAASAVLAAFFHAAALGGRDIDDLASWLDSLASSGDPASAVLRTLQDHDMGLDPAAVQAVKHHLDPRAEKTTSGVVRYLTLAMSSMISTQGRWFCGLRDDPDQFDMEAAIRDGATVYLLSDTQRRGLSAPLLSLFANEMFFAAQTVAQRHGHGQRLSPPFVGVLDELRYGVTVNELPFVAASMRKNGVLPVYAAQAAAQEEIVYGKTAAAELRAAAGVSVYGGIDDDSADDLADLAGTQPVVRGGTGHGGITEHLVDRPVLSVADQQQLANHQAVIRAQGLPLFIARIPLIFGSRRHWLYRRRLHAEARAATHERNRHE